ncbi:hypothetical protein [Weissella confusa]|uniref:hypothetical protein n=1 Tax=Weissella confusa TaxID=1583 RepID=UPI0022E252C7|nr:hypothetical protein [Weissella confusa]
MKKISDVDPKKPWYKYSKFWLILGGTALVIILIANMWSLEKKEQRAERAASIASSKKAVSEKKESEKKQSEKIASKKEASEKRKEFTDKLKKSWSKVKSEAKSSREETSSEKAASRASASSTAAGIAASSKAVEDSKMAYVVRFKDYNLYYLFDLTNHTVTIVETSQDKPYVQTMPYVGDDFNSGVDFSWDGLQMHAHYKYVDMKASMIISDAAGTDNLAMKYSVDNFESAFLKENN